MRKFSRTERILLVTAVFFVGTWAAFSLSKGFRVTPPAAGGVRLTQRINAKESAVRRLSSFNSRRAEIAAETVKYRPYLGQDKASPELEWSGLLKEIESLAKRSSVRLDSINPSTITPHEGWTEYRVIVESEGSLMPALLRFLDSLQTSPELLKVVQLKIVSSPEKERSFRCSVTLSKAAFSS